MCDQVQKMTVAINSMYATLVKKSCFYKKVVTPIAYYNWSFMIPIFWNYQYRGNPDTV